MFIAITTPMLYSNIKKSVSSHFQNTVNVIVLKQTISQDWF